MNEQTAGPPNAQPANREWCTSAPPRTPSGVFVSLLGDRQKQKEAWLHHCLHHGDNLHIYHLAISPYSRALFPSLSCHYSSLITTFAQLRHAKNLRRRQKHRCVCVSNKWKRSECVWGWWTHFPDNPWSSPAQTRACCSHSYAVLRRAFTHAVLWDSGISSEEILTHVCMVPNKQTPKAKLLLWGPTRILIWVTAPKNKTLYFEVLTLV